MPTPLLTRICALLDRLRPEAGARAAADDPAEGPGRRNVGPAETEARTPPPPRREIGGPAGLEPTRYGDWERNGRATDF